MSYNRTNGNFTSDYDGKSIFYRAWLNKNFSAKKCIVILHGYGEHSGRYENFAAGIAKSGYSFFVMDLRGHGSHEAELGLTPDLDAYIEDVNSIFKHINEKHKINRPVLLGHSFGAFLAIYYTLLGNNEEKIRLLIANASPMSFNMTPTMVVKRFFAGLVGYIHKNLKLHITLNPDQVSTDPTEVKKYIEDPLVHDIITINTANQSLNKTKWCLDNAGKMKIPVLLTHGGADEMSDCKGTQNFYKLCGSKDKTLIIYDGMRHEIYNEVDRKKVFKDLIDWLNQRN